MVAVETWQSVAAVSVWLFVVVVAMVMWQCIAPSRYSRGFGQLTLATRG